MQVIYAYRFVAYYGSDIPSTPWQQITQFIEQDNKIVQNIKEKGFYSLYDEKPNGYFAHRYEVA